MQRADQHIANVDRHSDLDSTIRNTCDEFFGGFFGKSRQQNVLDRNVFVHNEVNSSFDQRPTLARSGPSNNE